MMIRLYLVRHGEAKSAAEDPARPLTNSGKLRAVQTAELMAEALMPLAEPKVWAERLRDSSSPAGTTWSL